MLRLSFLASLLALSIPILATVWAMEEPTWPPGGDVAPLSKEEVTDLLPTYLRDAIPTAAVFPEVGSDSVTLHGTVAQAEDEHALLELTRAACQRSPALFRAKVVSELVLGNVGGILPVEIAVVMTRVDRSDLRRRDAARYRKYEELFLKSPGTGRMIEEAELQACVEFLWELRAENLVDTPWQPHLVTPSGRPTSYLRGGEAAVPEIGGFGSTEYPSFAPRGTWHCFRPLVGKDKRIRVEADCELETRENCNHRAPSPDTGADRELPRLTATMTIAEGQTILLVTPNAYRKKHYFPCFRGVAARWEYTDDAILLVTPHVSKPGE